MSLTQEELAATLNVSKSAIAKWETDGGIPDRDNLYKLAETMGVSVNDMHQIIRSKDYKDADLMVNITPDVIAILESYVSIIPKDNPSYEGSNEVEDNAASQKILDVFDVLLAGVEAVD